MTLRLFTLAAMSVGSEAAQWAFITAGSKSFMNYRHQADACHAYQIVKSKGVPEENIIMMAYDDIASYKDNPFPGQIFNKPTAAGTPGVDVYKGCNIDYKGAQVTPENYLGVLLGNASGKTLKSTADDEVFIFFSDHGAPGLMAFPQSGHVLHKAQLQSALKKMHADGKFKKLVFYLETCESGSMFANLTVPGLYALSAANPKESSWGTYCGAAAVVNGKKLNTCLGDLFSVAWMENVDAVDISTETLEKQFTLVKQRTNKSHVMQWSDTSFTSDNVDEFLGSGAPFASVPDSDSTTAEGISVRHVDLYNLYHAYDTAETFKERLAWGAQLQSELARQQAAEATYLKLAEITYPEDTKKQSGLMLLQESPDQPECEVAGHKAIQKYCADQFDAGTGFALQFHQVVVNICAAVARGLNFDVVGGAAQACSAVKATAVVV